MYDARFPYFTKRFAHFNYVFSISSILWSNYPKESVIYG